MWSNMSSRGESNLESLDTHALLSGCLMQRPSRHPQAADVITARQHPEEHQDIQTDIDKETMGTPPPGAPLLGPFT